jgi:tetratricopeptide (TPR) repeat protein
VKKETIITAAVFLSVGFLAGYIYNAQKSAASSTVASTSIQHPEKAAAEASSGDPASSVTSATDGPKTEDVRPAASGLPPGHPPIDVGTTIRFLEQKAAARPRDPKPRLELANFLYDQKQFEQAIRWYEKTLELDPGNINARTDLGTSYFSLGRPQDAIREYHKSLQLDPKHQPTLFNLIIANLEGTHDLDAAQVGWNELYRLNSNYPGLDRLKQDLDAARK